MPQPAHWFFFFFQAEDGIRDYKVTGVQTCALPISALDEWLTVTTGPTRHRFTVNPPRAIGIAPQVWAITIRRSDLSALQPYSLGTGLRRLRRSAVLIWASTVGRGGPTR